MLKKISKFLLKTNSVLFVFITYLFTIIILDFPFLLLINHFELSIGGTNLINNLNLPKMLFLGVLFIPIIETAIFQIGIIKLFLLIFPKYTIISIVASATFFSFAHSYSVYYIIYMFLIGVVLASLFFIANKKKINPFWTIFSVHALHNLTVVLINY